MAYAEQLQSGHFRGVFRAPGDRKKRYTETFTQRRQAIAAAVAAESNAADLGWRDPQRGAKRGAKAMILTLREHHGHDLAL